MFTKIQINIQEFSLMESKTQIEIGSTIHSYVFEELIGSGGFADVFKVRSLMYGTSFVAKVMVMKEEKIDKLWFSFDSEVHSLMRLDHHHIIRLYDYFRENKNFFIILEHCQGGSLMDTIKAYGCLRRRKLIQVTSELISAISYSHQCKIAHRDIKPANILFDEFGRVKLADFGISCLIQEENYFMQSKQCSLSFAAPEILAKKLHNPFISDIWALGVTIYMMTTGAMPWTYTNVRTLKISIESTTLEIPPDTPSCIKEIILGCLRVDTSRRISIEEAAKLIKVETDHLKPDSLPIPDLPHHQTVNSLISFSDFRSSSNLLPKSKLVRANSKANGIKFMSGNRRHSLTMQPTFEIDNCE